MKLHEFVEKFVCPNSLIRLWTPLPKNEGYGHQMLQHDGNSVCMNHQLLKGFVWQSCYNFNEVIGVKDICVDDFYREAINIVIKVEED